MIVGRDTVDSDVGWVIQGMRQWSCQISERMELSNLREKETGAIKVRAK